MSRPADEIARAAGPARLEADEEHAKRFAVELGLDRLVRDGAGALHAVDPADQFPRVARDARCFGKRSIGAGFDHPEIGACGASLSQRVINHAPVNTRDHNNDAEQQAQSEIG